MQTPDEIALNIPEINDEHTIIIKVGDQEDIYLNRPDFDQTEIYEITTKLQSMLEELTSMEVEPQQIIITIN